MASSDLDPSFVKALKLLLSRSKESTEQLKQMADELIDQRKKEIANRIAAGGAEEICSSGFIGKPSMIKKEHQEVAKKREREAERANLEKLKQDIANLSEEIPLKKIKLESGSSPVVSASASPRSTDSKEKERDRGVKNKPESKEKPRERLREIEEDIFFGLPSSSLASNKMKDVDKGEKEERSKDRAKEIECKEEKSVLTFGADSGSDTEVSGDELQKDGLEEMQFELEFGNLSCVVCKAFGVSSTNRLIECQECHSLYHQECHKPPVTENVNDPRFVWYCNKCAKNLKKIVTKSTTKKVKHPLPLNARESPVGRTSKIDPVPIQQPFKRLEQPIKSSASKDNGGSSTTPGNGRGLSGLASVAANLSKSSLDSSKVSKADAASRLSQLGSSGHSAFTSRTDAASKFVPSEGPSLKMTTPKSDSPFKPSYSVKSEPGKTSGSTGAQGQSKTQTGKSATGSNTTSNSSSATKMSQSSLMSADKRLQMMKKQAAKMAEKRSSLK